MTMNLPASALRLSTRLSGRQPAAALARKLHQAPLRSVAALSSIHHKQVGPSILTSRRAFSDGSHDDFAPKRKSIGDVDEAVKLIDEHVKSNRIMLYMKGNPSMPMCGFSARVVKILQDEGVDFASVNVLDYPSIREGVKKYSDWPTIPQLYVDAEFVGGCDIVTSMHESGELKELLSVKE